MIDLSFLPGILGAAAVVAAFAAVFYFSTRKKSPENSSTPPNNSLEKWAVYSPGTRITSGDSFDFPSTGSVNYIYRKAPDGMSRTSSISMTFDISGEGKLSPTDSEPPARLRLYMQRKGDTLTASEEDKRWWSSDVILENGTHTLTVNLDPSNWTNVFGKKGSERKAGFDDCIANLQHVGFTFGGSFAGHGVFAKDGPVHFDLGSYDVTV